MKQLLTACWLAGVWLMNQIGEYIALISSAADWSVLGWAFAGGTCFVLVEIYNGVTVSGTNRAIAIMIGLLFSMALTETVAEWLNKEQKAVAFVLGFLGYVLLSFLSKKARNPIKTYREVRDLKGDILEKLDSDEEGEEK